jgi:adenylate kinase
MNIILFGPQGCGKGTQAEFLKKKFGVYHLSTGDALRAEIKNGTELGKKVKQIIDRGELAPSEIINDIVLNASKDKKAKNGILFDGYPRTKEQWDFLKQHIKIDAAIELNLSEEESIKRIASRWMCPKCGKGYNTIFLKPKVDGYCDDDKSKLIQRDDDKPKAIKDRLKIYRTQTEPLKKEYSKLGILHVIDGQQPIAKVSEDISKILKK